MAQVLVQLVGFFPDFDEPFIWFVNLRKGVDKGISEIIEDGGGLFRDGDTPFRMHAHVCVPVARLEEVHQES